MHIWGTYVHMYTKYEVIYMEVCTDDDANANTDNANTNDNGQSMIV